MTSASKIKSIGGEQELVAPLHYGVTNSGRSSLRWALASLELAGKMILLPDFLCEIITDVLQEHQIKTIPYAVNKDFSFSFSKEVVEASDAIYLIRYFGMNTTALCRAICDAQKPLIIDDVFGIEPPVIETQQPWCYFNSLRKISPIADYSQLISNQPLVSIQLGFLPEFSQAKYQAKSLKADCLLHGKGEEQAYLALFNQGELLLNATKTIFLPSAKSSVLVNEFYRQASLECELRLQNLATAKSILPVELYADAPIDFPSFLPILLPQRDKVRHGLTAHQIFLAVHWPEVEGMPNSLSDSILSLPLDSRYSSEDIAFVCHRILELMDEM
ncbi:hypothetical protein [Salinivibrio sp. AR640]|uniref:hypothetical protein n=1 Tax=Salinivibrio sp. AR640 TaxID=1909437 RepID=UPI000986021E|nr:hypothetical protein [Salinivibrio sp. AR640]OOE93151.1 hypothetical protein BZG75_07700 [Salinivibrio sp. AR640]